MSPAEFDKHAKDYGGGMEHPLKRIAGSSLDQYIAVKARWLLPRLDLYGRHQGIPTAELSLLDYGCGDGIFLRHLSALGFDGPLTGCDISGAMLETARKRWDSGDEPRWISLSSDRPPGEPNSVDFVTLSAVLHHIDPLARAPVIEQIKHVIKPGGYLIIFEHNPWNIVTRIVVASTAIDQDAILLSSREATRIVQAAEMDTKELEYLLFFPPRIKPLHRLERNLRRIPLGGQFALSAQKKWSDET
jgi:SAM-dependent methyltransferase